jgi:hypothetical protein
MKRKSILVLWPSEVIMQHLIARTISKVRTGTTSSDKAQRGIFLNTVEQPLIFQPIKRQEG